MANLRARYLYPQEIDEIVTPLLSEAFKPYGYNDRSIEEDETFDGDPIIRVTADVDHPVPAERLSDTLSLIHAALWARNEERFVFLSAPGPAITPESGTEDDDEDM